MARDGNEALAQCSVERPDIVLTDIVMPDKDLISSKRSVSSIAAASGGIFRRPTRSSTPDSNAAL